MSMNKIIAAIFLAMMPAAITVAAEETPALIGEIEGRAADIETDKKVEELLNNLTTEEKVAQLFCVTPEALTGVDGVTMAGEQTEASYGEYPVGGLVYFQQNILSRRQLLEMLTAMQAISENRTGLPVFLAVDEEGGSVTRVSGKGIEGVPYVGDMYSVGASGDVQQAYAVGKEIGTYLTALNFNVDFAPVADVYTNPANTVIGDRAFGSDAELVSDMIAMNVRGMQETGIKATLKHFPGHGDTEGDTHTGYACSYKTLEEIRSCELLPFKAGIDAGAAFVMAGHISYPNILGDYTPASLSYTMLTDLLRGELGFKGIIITDALNMGAVSCNYSSGDAAVQAILAGADMLLMPADFHSAYAGVCQAVMDGRISEERLNASVRRIIREKIY